MSSVVATGAAALGFYVWLRRWQQCGYAGVIDLPAPLETHARTEQPPTTWSETLYLFKEALRYMYQETFGRWHAIDLFFGLAYLARRPTDEYPAADIAAAGHVMHDPHMQPQHARDLIQLLQEVKRYMLYCQGLKHHKPEIQLKHWRITTGLEAHDVLKHSPTTGLLRPAYVIFRDSQSQTIILCVRGTHSRSDMFTSLTGTVKPHHVVTPEGVALGYSHLGMLAAARWLLSQTKTSLIQALDEHPGYQLRIVGHSMGGGTAAMLTMMMREKVPELSSATAWAIACPACMTLDLAASCAPFVTTLVHGTDIVPTFSSGALDRLRDEVTQSSWFAEFQGDVQQRLAANFGASMRALRLDSAGAWTQRNIFSTAATSFRSCYSRAPRSCYSGRLQAAAAAATASSDADASQPVSPHAAAAPQHRSSWGFSILSNRLGRQQQQGATGCSSPESTLSGSTEPPTADGEDAALLAHSTRHASPLQWLRRASGRGRRPGYPTPANSDGGSSRRRSSEAGPWPLSSNGSRQAHSEASLVEHALQACLMAADSGSLQDSGGASVGVSGLGQTNRLDLRTAAPPAAASAFAAAGSSTAAGRGAALADRFAKVVLRTKRPAAPGKKDDDSEVLQPPLQQGRGLGSEPMRQAPGTQLHLAASQTANNTPASTSNPQLPLSSGASSDSAHAGPATTAAVAPTANPTTTACMDGVEGRGGAAHDPAAAASSAAKPHTSSLRSRKGWAWGGVLGAPGDHGWVSNDNSSRRSSLAGGHRVVELLGQTVGHTSRLMVETTGHLLKGGGSMLFGECVAPGNHHAAAAAAAAAGSAGSAGQVPVYPEQQQQQGGAGMPRRPGIVTAPSSTTSMDRDDADGPFVAALAASLAVGDGDESSTDSDSDPDLQEDMEGEGGDRVSFSLLDHVSQPALRGNISALVAAVSSDAASVGQGIARAQVEEDRAAEKLLQDIGVSSSEANMQQLALHASTGAGVGPGTAAAAAGEDGGVRHSGRQHQYQQQGREQQRHGDPGVRDAASSYSLRSESPIGGFSSQGLGANQAAAGDGAGGAAGSGDTKAAERMARRRMYPAGRVLHLMPRSACPSTPEVVPQQSAGAGDAAADADGSRRASRRLPPLTAAHGSVGLGDEYVLLELPRAEVYGRVKLCPSMVRDHFIPSYLRALDSVLGQLQQVAAGAGAAE